MSPILSMEEVLGIILAGGEGKRLHPLTRDRAKPAVPIAGNMRIIDFILTNFVRSEINKTYLLTQYKSDSLMDHVRDNWEQYSRHKLGEFIKCVPAQKRTDDAEWYQGTANAILQNKHLIEKHKPGMVAIFGGDHVYFMDIRQMVEAHKENDADATICALSMKKDSCPREPDGRLSFGIIDTDADGKVLGFREKPMPDDIHSDKIIASMGNYLFNTPILNKALNSHDVDFGKNILPKLVQKGKRIFVYDFASNIVPGMEQSYERGFWKDLGQVDDYYEANMMFASVTPKLNLYNRKWALMDPAAKFVFADGMTDEIERDKKLRRGESLDSIVSDGCILSGATVLRSVISKYVRADDYSVILDSVIFDDVLIGKNCKIKNTIIDKNVSVPDGTMIGYDKEADKSRGFYISPKGITVVPKDYKFLEQR